MSGKDDPFSSGGKTVIRPNPGGGAPRPPAPEKTSIQQQPAPRQPAQTPPHRNTPAPPPARGGGQYGVPDAAHDSWMVGGRRVQPHFPGDPLADKTPTREVDKIPLEVALNARDHVDFRAENPIATAASPLLILLGRLRLLIIDMEAVPLMSHVARSIDQFEKRVLEMGVPREEATIAKYALCATADDIVQNLPGTDRGVWMQYSMLAQFFQTRTSGVGFFEELDKLRANPSVHYDLLELMHACLSLGFEGKYRGAAGGDIELQRIRRDVYQTLRRLKPRPDDDISPRWRGLALRARDFGFQVPIWAIASFAGLALVAVYLLFRMLLAHDANVLAATIIGLHPDSDVVIERATFVPYIAEPASDTGQLERIRSALQDDLDNNRVAVEPLGEEIVIQVNNLVLFETGKSDVRSEFVPIAERIASALDVEPGQIRIVGHTDNVPLRPTSRFKSNYDLSVKRAESVEEVVTPLIADPTRIVVDGKGEDEPIADNKTREGRALNRRVEIMIPREETLQ